MNNIDNTNEIKMVENGAVIIVLFVILIVLTPSLTMIISNSLKMSAKTSTLGSIEMVKDLYTSINLTDDVALPFKVVYNRKGYTMYTCGEKYKPIKKIKVKIKGSLPKDGSIEIKTDGNIVVKKLKFGLYKCNQIDSTVPVCKI